MDVGDRTGLVLTGGHVVTADGRRADAEFWLEAGGALGTLLAPLLRRAVFRRNTRLATEGLTSHIEGRGSTSAL